MNPTITPNNVPQPAAAPAPVVATAPQAKTVGQNAYETVMLIFGALTIFSLVTNNGWLVKVSVMVFLGVAITSIVSSLSKSRTDKSATQFATPQATTAPAKKPMTVMRLLGIILLVLIGIPVIGYGLLIVFVLIAFSAGGGHAT